MKTTADMQLKAGFSVVDYMSMPSGAYSIKFRSEAGAFVTVVQDGHGGCNRYSSLADKPALDEWLAQHTEIAAEYLTVMRMPGLAEDVAARAPEWEDLVVMAICGLIDMRVISVAG